MIQHAKDYSCWCDSARSRVATRHYTQTTIRQHTCCPIHYEAVVHLKTTFPRLRHLVITNQDHNVFYHLQECNELVILELPCLNITALRDILDPIEDDEKVYGCPKLEHLRLQHFNDLHLNIIRQHPRITLTKTSK